MIDAIIFDKDGTLFDFRASWGAWAASLLREFAAEGHDPARLGAAIGFDPVAHAFCPDSPVIAGTPDEIAEALLPALPAADAPALVARINRLAGEAPMVPATDLSAVLGALRARGLRLGLATNDAEAPAHQHLRVAGVHDLFDFIAGFDSGHGAKPAPGQLMAFCARFGLQPSRVVMVGDSLHDLHAGRAAGMRVVAVLTGIANAEALAPHADAVLPDISGLGGWIDGLVPA
jgi:phosphoglycolate phosphatase